MFTFQISGYHQTRAVQKSLHGTKRCYHNHRGLVGLFSNVGARYNLLGLHLYQRPYRPNRMLRSLHQQQRWSNRCYNHNGFLSTSISYDLFVLESDTKTPCSTNVSFILSAIHLSR